MEAPASQLIRLPQVKQKTSLSRSEIYRRVALGAEAFPQPVRLGTRCTVWVSDEIDAWISARIAKARNRA
jgi:prophage regulatory protein